MTHGSSRRKLYETRVSDNDSKLDLSEVGGSVMTWMATFGEVTLDGFEAGFYLAIIQRAAAYLWDIVRDIEDEDPMGGVITGEHLFDRAPVKDKIACIHEVLTALLDPSAPAPQVTSTLEAAAYFPFALLLQDIQVEIDNEKMEIFNDDEEDLKYHFRKLTWEALEKLELPRMIEVDLAEGFDGQLFTDGCHSTDFSDWQEILEILEMRFFDDNDWILTSQHPQLLDGMEKGLAYDVGIDRGYFNNRLPKVSEEGAEALYKQIQQWQLSHEG